MQPQAPYGPPQNDPVQITPDYAPQPPASAAPSPNYPTSSNPADYSKPDYGFILANKPRPTRTMLGNGKAGKIIFVTGLVLFLVLFFVILKAILSSNQALDVPALVTVAQDQQELLHVLQGASASTSNSALSISNQNFVPTALLSLGSEQSGLIRFLGTNGQKLSPQQLGAKQSLATDNQLTTALTASTYNQVFSQTLQSLLSTYKSDTASAYLHTKNNVGRALLQADYRGARLLLAQITTSQ